MKDIPKRKSASYYKAKFGKGQPTTCNICGFVYPRFDGKISRVDGKWVCKYCRDDNT